MATIEVSGVTDGSVPQTVDRRLFLLGFGRLVDLDPPVSSEFDEILGISKFDVSDRLSSGLGLIGTEKGLFDPGYVDDLVQW